MTDLKVGDVAEHVHSKALYLVTDDQPAYIGVCDLRLAIVFFEKDDFLLVTPPVHNSPDVVAKFRQDFFETAMTYSRALLKSSTRHCVLAELAIAPARSLTPTRPSGE